MRIAVLSLMMLMASSSFANESIAVDPAAGLMGLSHCRSEGDEEAYKVKIYLHEDFLQGPSYGIFTAELADLPAFNLYANFVTTSPALTGDAFTVEFNWLKKSLGTLKLEGQGLSGTLAFDGVTLKCQPLNIAFE